MQKFSSIAPALALILLAFAVHDAVAQSGRGRDRVCVYEHADYRGWEQCYIVGEGNPDLGKRRNKVSSVRIEGRAQITIYELPNFAGRELKLSEDVPDLSQVGRSWNDQVDSLRVSPRRGGGGDWGGSDPRPHRDDRVCVYEHADYQGSSRCWEAGDEVRDLKSVGWNDGISSVRAFGRTRVTFYEHNDFRGEQLNVEGDLADLTQLKEGRSDWNDRISSLRVRGGR